MVNLLVGNFVFVVVLEFFMVGLMVEFMVSIFIVFGGVDFKVILNDQFVDFNCCYQVYEGDWFVIGYVVSGWIGYFVVIGGFQVVLVLGLCFIILCLQLGGYLGWFL